jgi:hypothetical protein
MATADNKKLNDKAFIKQYGKTTTFSYGCEPDGVNYADGMTPQSDIYVYRMTMTNEDGNVVEYTPEFMRYRCEQMGAKTVPVMWNGIIPDPWATAVFNDDEDALNFKPLAAGDWVKNKAEQYYDGPDPIGKTHIREGVVVRIVNRPKFTAFKHKNWNFKALEGIVKVEAIAPDIEEEQEIAEVI